MKTETKHTLWSVRVGDKDITVQDIKDALNQMDYEQVDVIGERVEARLQKLAEESPDDPNAESAAPGLLAALQATATLLGELMIDESIVFTDSAEQHAASVILEEARAAIAAAEGGAE